MKAYQDGIKRNQILWHDEPVILHTPEDFQGMRRAGKLAAQVLNYIAPFVEPGISTGKLDQLCHAYILEHQAIPAPLNYNGYPKATCISVNHVVCHGIPSNEKILQNGDILNIDITVIKDGWYGDTSRMFVAGKPSLKAQHLIDTTYEAMMRAIDIVRPGVTLGDIGHTIQSFAESKRCSVVRDFCGHGLGQIFHMAPNVVHYGKAGTGMLLEEGMFLTIEPMINLGKYDTKVLSDGWTAVTKDKSLSAQFEHSLGITASGYEIFTLSQIA